MLKDGSGRVYRSVLEKLASEPVLGVAKDSMADGDSNSNAE